MYIHIVFVKTTQQIIGQFGQKL